MDNLPAVVRDASCHIFSTKSRDFLFTFNVAASLPSVPSPLAQSQSTLTATHQLYQLALNDDSMHLKLRWETFLFSVFYNSVTGLGITAGYHHLWAHRSYNGYPFSTFSPWQVLVPLHAVSLSNFDSDICL